MSEEREPGAPPKPDPAAEPSPPAPSGPTGGPAGVPEPARPPLWSAALELHIPIIDGQHRRLVAHLQDLQAAIDAGRPRHEVVECLGFLRQYTEEHFRTEERFLEAHQFPALAQHRQLHAAFRANVDKAMRAVDSRLTLEQSVLLVKSMLVHWYLEHIQGADMQYADHLRNHPAQPPGRPA